MNSLPLITGSAIDKSDFLKNLAGETPTGEALIPKNKLLSSKFQEPESEPPY